MLLVPHPSILQTQEKLVDQDLSHSYSATIEDIGSNSANVESEIELSAEPGDSVEDNTVNELMVEESLNEDNWLDSIYKTTLMLTRGCKRITNFETIPTREGICKL